MNIEVIAAIIESNGGILIAKRKSDDVLFNRWEFPDGKIRKIRKDEIAEQCLKREIKEELGIGIEVERFITSSNIYLSSYLY